MRDFCLKCYEDLTLEASEQGDAFCEECEKKYAFDINGIDIVTIEEYDKQVRVYEVLFTKRDK